MPSHAMMQCPKCRGRGVVVDPRKFGAMMREARAAKGISMRAMAKRIGISPAFLSDMELGNRPWPETRWKDFEEALG